jgi:uncharacterized protein (TIGR02217 family)
MSGAFLESPRFPDRLAIWAKTGIGWSNQVVTVRSGREVRNQVWVYPRARFDLANALAVVAIKGEGAASLNVAEVRNWIIAMQGQYQGFRFKDHTDFADEGAGVFIKPGANPPVVVSGDGTTAQFQMVKTYTIGAVTQMRLIAKPVSASVQVFDNGSPVSPTIDYTTGIVTFGSAPSSGHILTWTGQFDVPVRFAADMIDWALDPGGMYVLSVPLIEIRI